MRYNTQLNTISLLAQVLNVFFFIPPFVKQG